MPHVPLIKASDYMNRFINRRHFNMVQPGQLKLEELEDSISQIESVSIRRQFKEWIEDVEGIDAEIPHQLVDWLNKIGEFVSNDDLFEWCYSIFKYAIKIKDQEALGVEV